MLLVALIGLANMLLVSVHDELRETGLRRALGAEVSEVVLHFLSQGVLLSLLGATVGLVIGAARVRDHSELHGNASRRLHVVGGSRGRGNSGGGRPDLFGPSAPGGAHPPVEALRYE